MQSSLTRPSEGVKNGSLYVSKNSDRSCHPDSTDVVARKGVLSAAIRAVESAGSVAPVTCATLR